MIQVNIKKRFSRYFFVEKNFHKHAMGLLILQLKELGCLAGTMVTCSPLTSATRVQYLELACEMDIRSPNQTGGFPPGTAFSSHKKTTGTQTCFVIVVK